MTSENETTYCLDENVFLLTRDDITQILDFDRGQFYGLDAIGTLMISLVLEQGSEETVKYISQTY